MTGAKMRFSQEKILQDTSILLDNLKNQPTIAQKMAAFKYDNAKIEEGKNLWNKAKQQYDLTKKETAESTKAYTIYSQKLEALKNQYSLDRQKAKTLFKGQKDKLQALAIHKAEPRAYSVWITEVQQFYTQLTEQNDLLKELEAMQISTQEVEIQLKKVNETKAAYSSYIREKGESQDATKKKEQAFANLTEWARDCYAIAKIALKDDIQLLESLAKLVKG